MGARARTRFTRKQEILRANNDMLVGRELAGWDPGLGKPCADSRGSPRDPQLCPPPAVVYAAFPGRGEGGTAV